MNTSVSARPAGHAFPLALIVLALGVMATAPQWHQLAASAQRSSAFSADTAAAASIRAPAAGTMLPYGVFPGTALTSSEHTLPYGTP
ncbi:hypothetical protein [Xanthomonas sp. NCPPB 2632]|jgi:hypothetical protein|uniref:hypothetical protein n=1 Tax=Xanthomonas sp. NCPPB 2632 TaxID=3240912 RepID=UPI0035151152